MRGGVLLQSSLLNILASLALPIPAQTTVLLTHPHPPPAPAAGLEPDGTPYLCGMDSIGAQETAVDFMVAGTATDSLLGICESLWRPDLVRRAGGPYVGRPRAAAAGGACAEAGSGTAAPTAGTCLTVLLNPFSPCRLAGPRGPV